MISEADVDGDGRVNFQGSLILRYIYSSRWLTACFARLVEFRKVLYNFPLPSLPRLTIWILSTDDGTVSHDCLARHCCHVFCDLPCCEAVPSCSRPRNTSRKQARRGRRRSGFNGPTRTIRTLFTGVHCTTLEGLPMLLILQLYTNENRWIPSVFVTVALLCHVV